MFVREIGIGLGNDLALFSAKTLRESLMTQSTDAYMCHQALMS